MTELPPVPETVSEKAKESVLGIRDNIKKVSRREILMGLGEKVSLDDVVPLFELRRSDVVRLLGVGNTTWKKFLRTKLGILRWPGRRFKQLKDMAELLRRRRAFAEERDDVERMLKVSEEMRKLEEQKQKEIDEIKDTSRVWQELQGW